MTNKTHHPLPIGDVNGPVERVEDNCKALNQTEVPQQHCHVDRAANGKDFRSFNTHIVIIMIISLLGSFVL